jgi:hypothetical protein
MLNAGVLTFQEFVMREPLPMATVHEAVLDFLRGRDDVVVFGATAVNAHVNEPRMTQAMDLMSPRAAELAEELRAYFERAFPHCRSSTSDRRRKRLSHISGSQEG